MKTILCLVLVNLALVPGASAKGKLGQAIKNAYEDAQGKTATKPEVAYWKEQIHDGNTTVDQLRRELANADEARNVIRHSLRASDGRKPTQAAVNYWDRQLRKDGGTLADIKAQIAADPNAQTRNRIVNHEHRAERREERRSERQAEAEHHANLDCANQLVACVRSTPGDSSPCDVAYQQCTSR